MTHSYIRTLFITSLFLIPSVSFALGDTNPNGTGDDCLHLKYNVSYGMKDANTEGEVTKLQSFLKNNGYLNGVTTGFFGINTRSAVKVFQKELLEGVALEDIDKTMVTNAQDRQTLVATSFRLSNSGYVGTYTRAKIAYASCEQGSVSSNTTTTTTTTTATTVATVPKTTTTVATVPTAQVVKSCVGTMPTGAGVRLGYYTEATFGPSAQTSANTVWTYGATSCGWTCDAPMMQSGNGCKNPAPGTGVTVTLNNISTGQKFAGVPVTFGIAGLNLGREIATYTTNGAGVTSEAWFGQIQVNGTWTNISLQVPGYKIRSAVGCSPWVFVHGSGQVNNCTKAVDGTPVTIDLVKGDISTVPKTVLTKSSYAVGEKLEGYIEGGDPQDTWGCIDSPNTQAGYECTSGRTDVWRKLGGAGDGWQVVSNTDGDRIVLSPMSTTGYPVGKYTVYARAGQFGAMSQGSVFTLTKGQ